MLGSAWLPRRTDLEVSAEMGSVVLSIDAELGWGHHDREIPPAKRLRTARRGWIRLLHLLDEYQIPSTWAIVGHLFVNHCDGEHADHPAPPGWFARERGEWEHRPEIRFGYGLTEATQKASAGHEIACHSFSHVEFDPASVSQKLARAEIEASIESAKAHDIEFSSFVFPRNRIGHQELLAEYDFTCYRGHSSGRWSRSPALKTLQKLARASVVSPPLVQPYIDEYGLVDVPASMYLFGYEGLLRRTAEALWGDPMLELAKRGIDRAAASDDGLFHLWFHPNDLIEPPDFRRMTAVLEHLEKRRDETDLTVETMQSVAERVLESRRPSVEDYSRYPSPRSRS
jgi:peptidoglycan/xylan/chitin deacetylase (PgdA/CDA1 family)